MTPKQKNAPPKGMGETGLPSLDSFESEFTSTRDTETIAVVAAAVLQQPERAMVVVAKGLDAGLVVPVGMTAFTIGRASDAKLVLSDRGVSQRHARISRVEADGDDTQSGGPQFVLEDLGSKNGTFVDGVPVTEPRRLSFGDSFQIGPDVLLRLTVMTAAEEQAARQLHKSSMRDGLTNAFNRRYFAQRLQAELAHALREDTPLAVMTLNFDQFKRINDTHGNSAGDVTLQDLVRRVLEELRPEDVFARVDSQQFAVLLRGMGADEAIACAERIRAAIEQHDLPLVPADRLTVSLGVATSSETKEGLLELALARLGTAKAQGRNRVCSS